MEVHFKKVGRLKLSFSRELKGELTYEWLYKQVQPFIISRNIEVYYDKEIKHGYIFGYFRPVGEFYLEEMKNDIKI